MEAMSIAMTAMIKSLILIRIKNRWFKHNILFNLKSLNVNLKV